jgi:hypothetical protein
MGGIKGWGRAHGRKERQVQVSRSRNLKEEIEIVAFRCIYVSWQRRLEISRKEMSMFRKPHKQNTYSMSTTAGGRTRGTVALALVGGTRKFVDRQTEADEVHVPNCLFINIFYA